MKKITIPTKYLDIISVFLSHFVVNLPEYTSINNYSINLIDNKKLSYSLIYNLKLVDLGYLRIYIKNNLANRYIKLFKFFIIILILFVYKKNRNFCLYINY